MKYPIIIALDPPPDISSSLKWVSNILENTYDLVIGYKIGLPLILDLGRDIEQIMRKLEEQELIIADLKLADIGDIMLLTIKKLYRIGFNTYIVHSFIGYRNALDKITNYVEEINGKLITILSMSHPGSVEVIDQNYEKLLNITIKTNAWGCIIGATKTEIIKHTRRIIRELNKKIKILSPGIGIQGAKPGSAINAGADYEIIGRLITWTEKPREKLYEIIKFYSVIK